MKVRDPQTERHTMPIKRRELWGIYHDRSMPVTATMIFFHRATRFPALDAGLEKRAVVSKPAEAVRGELRLRY